MDTAITPRPARDLTPGEQKARAEAAYDVDQRLKSALAAGREAAWEVAEACADFADSQGYLDLGFDSLNEYLGDPDIGISRSFFQKLVRIARFARTRQLVDEFRTLELTKVSVVLPAMQSGQVPAEQAISDVRSLSRSDLVEAYIGPRERNLDPLPEPEPEPESDDDAPTPASPEVVDGEVVEKGPQGAAGGPEAPSDAEVVEDDGLDADDAEGPADGLFASTAANDPADEPEGGSLYPLGADREATREEDLRAVYEVDVEACKALHLLLIDTLAQPASMPRLNAKNAAPLVDHLKALIDLVERNYAP